MTLTQFINQNRDGMLRSLNWIVKDLKRDMKSDPKTYIDPYSGNGEPSIDVRLCIDLDQRHGYIFRTGDVQYDPYFSRYCGASSIGPDTDPEELLTELIEQLEE